MLYVSFGVNMFVYSFVLVLFFFMFMFFMCIMRGFLGFLKIEEIFEYYNVLL